MPFEIPEAALCPQCPHGVCVSYIREQSRRMKDRDTQYRVSQRLAMACCFDSWLPAGPGCPTPEEPLSFYLDQLVANARAAGTKLEALNHFGTTERPFFLTEAQLAKVRGDVFEMVMRALLWNHAAAHNAAIPAPDGLPYPIAVVTLGDNYDLSALFSAEPAQRLREYVAQLAADGMGLSYSTPDVVCVRLASLPPPVQQRFAQPIANLSLENQQRLVLARNSLEGQLTPSDVLFASGLKTSIRSDRMYQFLFEANAWKFIWRSVFGVQPAAYHTLMSRSFGADPEKLRSIEFGSHSPPTRAIDTVTQVATPADVATWWSEAIARVRGTGR